MDKKEKGRKALDARQNSIPSNDTEFMLAEYKQVADFWSKTDSRLEGTIRLYLTLATIVLSGFIFLSKDIFGKSFFWDIAFVVSIIFFLGGVLSFQRIVTTSLLKTEYIVSINLIRQFFVDQNPSLKQYLFLPIGLGEETDTSKIIRNRFKKDAPTGIYLMMQALCSILCGFSVFSLVLIINGQGEFVLPIILGGIVTVLAFFILQMLKNRIQKRFIKKLGSRLNKDLSNAHKPKGDQSKAMTENK